MDDILTEAEEERWCAKQREKVLAYLAGEDFQLPNLGIGPLGTLHR